jgi:Fe2+ transport system protein FeoA
VKQAPAQSLVVVEGRCAGPKVCPLSRVRAGTVVCIKQLSADPQLTERLRELGLVEDQEIKLLAKGPGFICLVCNARLGLSRKLADSILVEALPASIT